MESTLKVFKKIINIGNSDETCSKFVDLMLEFVKTEYNKLFPELRFLFEKDEEMEGNPTEEKLLELIKKANKFNTDEEMKAKRLLAKIKMKGFLIVLAEISNYKQMEQIKKDLVKQIATIMLSERDEKIQRLAVDTLAKIGQKHITQNHLILQNIASKLQGKDQLFSIDLATFSSETRSVIIHFKFSLGAIEYYCAIAVWEINKKERKERKIT